MKLVSIKKINLQRFFVAFSIFLWATIGTAAAQDQPTEPVGAPQVQTTPENGYPAVPTPTTSESEAAYPVAPPAQSTPENPTPYPAPVDNGDSRPTPTTVAVIGDSAESSPEAVNTSEPLQNGGPGRIYLWGGFLMGLLIFGTAVFGAIILFTRRNS